MIERPPQLTDKDIAKAYIDLSKKRDDELTSLIEKINERYEYWSNVKYEKTPPSLSNTDPNTAFFSASRTTCNVFAMNLT